MPITLERRLLQVAIASLCIVPLLAGAAGMALGPGFLRGVRAPIPADLDSHVRYLSGLLFGVGILGLSAIPRVEDKGGRLRLLCLIVVIGGLARAWSLTMVGPPGIEHRVALCLELVAMPLILLWQARIARHLHRPSTN